MRYSVADFYTNYRASITLVAGHDGLARSISEVSILDYELLPGLKAKYQRENFTEQQLVLTTFMYAREDPYLIGEAIKYLVAKGVSALLIKNVFKLTIPDTALRYASVRNFPIFLVSDDLLFFDQLIFEVSSHIKLLEQNSALEQQLDRILLNADNPQLVRELALELNPSFGDELRVSYIRFYDDQLLEPTQYEKAFAKCSLAQAQSFFCPFRQGLLFIESDTNKLSGDARPTIQQLITEVFEQSDPAWFGVSEKKYGLQNFGQAVREALWATQLAMQRQQHLVLYEELGTLRILLPCAEQAPMQEFARKTLQPLREFDTEHLAQLEHTLNTYIDCEAHIAACAQKLGQHENTVRYRLDKISLLTQLNYRKPSELMQLALACQLSRCHNLPELI